MKIIEKTEKIGCLFGDYKIVTCLFQWLATTICFTYVEQMLAVSPLRMNVFVIWFNNYILMMKTKLFYRMLARCLLGARDCNSTSEQSFGHKIVRACYKSNSGLFERNHYFWEIAKSCSNYQIKHQLIELYTIEILWIVTLNESSTQTTDQPEIESKMFAHCMNHRINCARTVYSTQKRPTNSIFNYGTKRKMKCSTVVFFPVASLYFYYFG